MCRCCRFSMQSTCLGVSNHRHSAFEERFVANLFVGHRVSSGLLTGCSSQSMILKMVLSGNFRYQA